MKLLEWLTNGTRDSGRIGRGQRADAWRRTRRLRRPATVWLAFGALALAAGLSSRSTWGAKQSNPVITQYGEVTSVPNAALVPRSDASYQIVFDATKGGDESSKVSESLRKVARAVNLFANAGVAKEKVNVAVVLHSDATVAALSNAAYRKKFKQENPNQNLLVQLEKHGVRLYVCGQALAERGFEPQDVADPVRTAQAALTAVAELQRRGYHLQAL